MMGLGPACPGCRPGMSGRTSRRASLILGQICGYGLSKELTFLSQARRL